MSEFVDEPKRVLHIDANHQVMIHAFLESWFAHNIEGHFLELRALNKRIRRVTVADAEALPSVDPSIDPTTDHPVAERSSGPKTLFTGSLDAAERFIVQWTEAGRDVYAGCLPREFYNDGSAASCSNFTWAWVDIDYGNVGHRGAVQHGSLDDARAALAKLPPPHMLVHTGGGIHAWWRLSGRCGSVELNRRIASYVGGDIACSDPPRILRIPGTFNFKVDGHPRPATLLEAREGTVDASAFAALPDPRPAPVTALARPRGAPRGDKPYDRANDVPTIQLLGWLGVELHQQSGRVVAACPVHGGSNVGQFVIGGGKYNTCHCFGDCNASFSNVDLVAKIRRVEPREAVNIIAERFGFEGFPPPREAGSGGAPAPSGAPSGSVIITTSGGDWESRLVRKKGDALENNPYNVAIILRDSPAWKGIIAYDELAARPFAQSKQPTERPAGVIGDVEITHISGWLASQSNWGLNVGTDTIRAGILAAAHDNSFNPVKKYLDGLVWDGSPRIKYLAEHVLGTTSAIELEMVTKWMLSAIARAFRPGCKVDTCLVLVGAQGLLKSSFFSVLGGDWYSNTPINIQDKDRFLQVRSRWIYELAEVNAAMARWDAEALKAFMSSASDTFRPPYAGAVTELPRMGVFGGTANAANLLQDDTGSRRWWCVMVKNAIDIEWIKANRDHLWAEAVSIYNAMMPEPCWWFDAEGEARVALHNKHFNALNDDGWIDILVEAVKGKSWVGSTDTLSHVLEVPRERHNKTNRQRLVACFKAIGWEPKKDRTGLAGFAPVKGG